MVILLSWRRGCAGEKAPAGMPAGRSDGQRRGSELLPGACATGVSGANAVALRRRCADGRRGSAGADRRSTAGRTTGTSPDTRK